MGTLNRTELKQQLNESSLGARYKYRMWKDVFARYGIGLGGWSVIAAVLLIFFYLIYVVFPMFMPASMELKKSYAVPGNGQTVYMEMDEYHETAFRVTDSGEIVYFLAETGEELGRKSLELPAGVKLINAHYSNILNNEFVLTLSNNETRVVKHGYKVTYPNDVRTILNTVESPLGEDVVIESSLDRTFNTMLRNRDSELVFAANNESTVELQAFSKTESMLMDGIQLEQDSVVQFTPNHPVDYMTISGDAMWLYVASDEGQLSYYDIRDREEPRLVSTKSVGANITNIEYLLGDISLLIATDKGTVQQWFPVRNNSNNVFDLMQIREFDKQGHSVTDIKTEFGRKAFVTADDAGYVGVYHATAHRTVMLEKMTDSPLSQLIISPRADALLLEDAKGQMHFVKVDNEHPEISWSSLWGEVWYEGYEEPEYVWQSSAANTDFEPKYSLAPLTFGTLKAAFYAMLIGVPLAIMGAIYTAFFMAPRMRQVVKPTIEIMEALPTVILGFLAGLWLAPAMEANLPGFFALILVVPLGVLIFGFAWSRLPSDISNRVPEGWRAALLIPVVIILGWGALSSSTAIESALFDGNMRSWLTNDMGITYDQRNSMVIGFAMGFAVIPTIFSITEDAIFSVPRHLVNGSLALGASTWQTLVGVVLPTASPGIFSGVMIGFGRAVGETMIVLMATGNTPIMDMNIFEGMRTLAANIAVEMPESEVGSSHYRILFLAAVVLFAFTFFFNTVAELVRQRLRKKYGSL